MVSCLLHSAEQMVSYLLPATEHMVSYEVSILYIISARCATPTGRFLKKRLNFFRLAEDSGFPSRRNARFKASWNAVLPCLFYDEKASLSG
jgi:hypothetical protein